MAHVYQNNCDKTTPAKSVKTVRFSNVVDEISRRPQYTPPTVEVDTAEDPASQNTDADFQENLDKALAWLECNQIAN